MAALETIRTKFGIGASLIIAFGLLLFLVNPSDIIQTFQSASTKYDVGKINGKRITYTDFDQKVKEFSEVREMLTGTSASSEEIQRQTRESAWQNLVDEYLVIPTIEKAGIRVGKEEQMDLWVGENISSILLSMGIFADENGNYSTAAVHQFLENASADETGRMVLLRNYLQNAVRSTRYNEKYNALFTASAYVNSLEQKNAVSENNTTANVSFVMAPNTYYPMDSTVVVSSQEIKKFYDDHKESFKQNATRDIEYVVYEVKPSAADIAAQNDDFASLYEEFASAENVRAFLQRNSDRQWSDNWVKEGDLRSVNRDVDAFVTANKSGVSPVYTSGETFYAARIMENANVPDSVYVRHIMLQGTDARHLADSLMDVLKKGNFAALATLYSADKGNAADGEQGNIGWMTQNMMIPGFESVLTAKVGQPYVITTQYGTHIVEVTKATKPVAKKKVAVFEKTTLPSKETYANVYNKANILAVRAAGKYSDYKAACDSTGTYSRSLTINEGTDSYGAINHAKEVTRWAFDNKPGKASGIITVDNNYFFIVAVKDAHKEGYAEVKDVAETIRTQLYREKYSQARKDQVAADIEGLTSLDAIAEKLNASVSNVTDVTFSTSSAPTTEPAFVGAVAAAKEGAITGPVAGIMGTYVLQVNGREVGAFYTEDDAKSAQARMESYHAQMLLPLMMENTVKDNRARFY
ncbi:MAG: SurA N-terminal domain-containing protein [Bacteroidales bacterium]|nr:SurA N-terminal domain-containing protein [Bacteroidales bacterium]